MRICVNFLNVAQFPNIMVDDSLGKLYDVDIGADVSDLAAHRVILQIPDYRLSKPLEIAVIGHREQGVVVEYSATHYLPSTQYENGAPTGNALVGRGKTPEEAGDSLCELIVGLWADLKDVPKEKLGPEPLLQQQYLRTLFLN